jgi:hypothetical protein
MVKSGLFSGDWTPWLHNSKQFATKNSLLLRAVTSVVRFADILRSVRSRTVGVVFQACAYENWDEFLKFYPASAVGEQLNGYLGGKEIISIGEPFKSGSCAD